ncbi:hypothetical protein SCOR_03005 [Sulfidibacter corallicola]|uniref:Uncharacterized protein n=1 Tax=Sulfidibacter corallicola TaxID=2818388 RepID=A0A8A4TH53_SULCO|nr:hypothetical protein [Sulfidibacter corallicola]QTD48502.1 hypothetical protein J3U87_23225 [Sulfidibacter corallicola]
MSLKAFHVFFILISILMTTLVVGWSVRAFKMTNDMSHLGFGCLFFILGLGLTGYAVKILKDVGRNGTGGES